MAAVVRLTKQRTSVALLDLNERVAQRVADQIGANNGKRWP
jgi:hypothetical protein